MGAGEVKSDPSTIFEGDGVDTFEVALCIIVWVDDVFAVDSSESKAAFVFDETTRIVRDVMYDFFDVLLDIVDEI